MKTVASSFLRGRSTILLLAVLALALSWLPGQISAQEVTATINGTIMDPSGGGVSNAEVTAKDADRGTVYTTKTNDTGFYNLNRLPVGRYEVRVTAPGFRTAVQQSIELQLNQVAVIDVQMTLGNNSETVEVTDAAPLLQTEGASVGTVIDQRANVNLPLATRNYLELTLVTPGAVTPSPSGFSNNGQTVGESSRPEINGNRFTANDYVLDGMDNNQASDNFVGYAPQPDAIQEFNLIAQNAPADFGNYMGGIISAVIRSGTNSIHGSAFEFFRNDALNANEWSNKIETPYDPRPLVRWNQFGAAVGGPIIRNKLFFFADYQGSRFDIPASSSNFSVFTTAERTGDVSELVANGQTIIDPTTGLPFPNNQIPQNRLSPAALAIINSNLYPTPINGNLSQNAVNTQSKKTIVDQGDLKMDWSATDKDQVFGRYSQVHQNVPVDNSYALAYNALGFSSAWNLVLGYTRTISTSLVNDARVGVNYVKIGQNNVSSSFAGDAGTLFSIPGLPSDFLPAIQFGSASHVTGAGNSSTVFGTKDSLNNYYDTSIQYQDVVSWTHGKHSTRFGFQGWRLRMNGFFPGNSGDAGTFSFSGQYSGSPETDFLLGLPSQIGVGLNGPDWGQRGNIFAGFVQDDWKLTPKLTVNLGLRYENHTPWYEVNDKQTNWNPDTGALELPGQNGNNRALYNDYNGIENFQPRIGVAYLLFPKTVIRGGYSLSSFMEGTGQGLRLPENPPASTDTSIDYRALTFPNTTLDQGFSAVQLPGQCTIQGLQNADPACYNGAVLRVWDKNVRPAVSSQWNLFVEHEFSAASTLQVGYVGQRTRHLTVAENLSQLQLQPDGTTLPSPYFADAQDLVSQGVLPLATYSAANQNYNSLQASLKGRLNHGLSYQLSYTWSHCLTNSVGFFGEGGQSASQSAWWQNLYDQNADYGSCYYDVTNVFTGYVIYDLPFGRGKTYGADMGKVGDALIGGWRLSLIPTIRGGFPLSLGASNDESGTGTFAPRPNCIAPPHVLGKSQPLGSAQGGGYQWFDPNSYAEPSSRNIRDLRRKFGEGPGRR